MRMYNLLRFPFMAEPEYVCCDCDKIFPFSAAILIPHVEEIRCPVCGSNAIERLPEAVVHTLEDLHAIDAEHHE